MRVLRVVATLSLLATWRLGAQSASPYLPISHWATPYIEHLITRGVVVDPTPLTRPWRETAIVQALKGADTTGHGTVNGGANVDFRFGPIVAVTHPELDTRLKYDPDWYGRKNRVIA